MCTLIRVSLNTQRERFQEDNDHMKAAAQKWKEISYILAFSVHAAVAASAENSFDFLSLIFV